MRFNPKARLDPSQIDSQRGGGGVGGGGGGIRIGGIGGLIVLVLALLFGINPGDILGGNSTSQQQSPAQPEDPGEFSKCQTGADANQDEDCQLVGITNSVNAFWTEQFPKETNGDYQPAQTVPFTGVVNTNGCGQATSDVGPFYCPNDSRVYLDTTFFQEMLEGRLGGRDAPFTRAYVVAHEYGHHIENQLGIMTQVRTQRGANSDAVKLELMADCLAGAWAKHAQETPDASGQPLISDLTQQDISDAINAAQTVGDDRIQQRTQGRVVPNEWTHGSAQQREEAFNHGLKNGTIRSCNLF